MVDRSLVVGVAVYGDQLVERQRPTTIADAPGGLFVSEQLKLAIGLGERLADGESRTIGSDGQTSLSGAADD